MQNETIKENYVPKEQYDADLSSLQESLRSDYVPRDHYELAVKQLEEEKVEHAQTRLKMKEVVDKLEEALGEITNLREQMQQQKQAYDKMQSSLKSKHMQETSKTLKLETKCSDIVRQCEMQEQILSAKNNEIKALEKKLQDQQNLYRKEVSEADIERKQQRYIAQMMEEQSRKNARQTHQAVLKTKANKR